MEEMNFIHFKKTLIFVSILLFVYVIDFLGLLVHLFELNYGRTFYYPNQNQLTAINRESAKNPNFDVNYVHNYSSIHSPAEACTDEHQPFLLLVIKSKIDNFEHRQAIRRTWGINQQYNNFYVNTIFLLGVGKDVKLMEEVYLEAKKYKDILQSDFVDTYYNNTIKMSMGLRWVANNCPKIQFLMFVDDDYYVSLRNVFLFLDEQMITHSFKSATEGHNIYAGYVIQTAPHRHKFSKWYISLEEYPFHKWPPYITAGSFLLSRDALLKIYHRSLYTPLFRFDDIYLGILALKANITLLHCNRFHFNKPKYSGPESYRDIIASHGFNDFVNMEHTWRECRSKGYA